MKRSLKNMFRISALLFILVGSLMMSSCSKDDANMNAPGAIGPELTGNWMIHYFFKVTDQSNNYVDYTFTFNNNGSFTATKNGAINNGTWKEEVDSGKRKLILDFDGSVTDSALRELEEDWIVVSAGTTLINLEDNGATFQFMKM